MWPVPFLVVAAFTRAASTASSAPPNMTITSLDYGGTGCPHNSVGQFLSSYHSTIAFIIDGFYIPYGPTTPITELRKNCQLTATITYTSKYQYAVSSIDYRGKAKLDSGVN